MQYERGRKRRYRVQRSKVDGKTRCREKTTGSKEGGGGWSKKRRAVQAGRAAKDNRWGFGDIRERVAVKTAKTKKNTEVGTDRAVMGLATEEGGTTKRG